ncbi:MAG: Smr/MutS family protein [Rhodobacteraceae bacterium]|nr:Smr/MutS family protein [Paracoccaceae bacterium]
MARRKKQLSEDDHHVWSLVKASLTPMRPEKKWPQATKPPIAPIMIKPKPIALKPLTRIGRAAAEPNIRLDLALDPMHGLAIQKPAMDQRTHTKMRKGKLKPEARLDLHGMRAAHAHVELLAFVRRCHGGGKRLILVITGKGNSTRDEGAIMPSRQGILRHSLPHWLSSAEMRPMILQITPAHLRHGGGGAYYVYLKRKGRSG